ncbi:MAG TPA: hypothetical protein VNO50_18900 [Pyrinomonadaceae bacterium]|nr:hypothetical protein [Pyrinomonadaceae bacterium]
MPKQKPHLVQLIAALALLLVQFSVAEAQKTKKIPRGVPVLWNAPGDIGTRNLFLGPGGEAMKPDLSNITFLEEEKGGYSGTKYRIRDGAGREWVAKVSKESQSEVAAVRLLWATGFETEINYLVPRLTIPGKGTFEDVRLEGRPASEKRFDEWKWEQNPFAGRREFQGLKIMMLFLENWDIKDSNNEIIHVKGTNRLRYVVSDLGATFGKTGGGLPFIWTITRSRNNPEDYEKAKFVEGVEGNFVKFRYSGKKKAIFDDITVAQARWLGGWLSRLSKGQIRDSFRAANYSADEIETLTEAVVDRIEQLRTVRRGRSRRR